MAATTTIGGLPAVTSGNLTGAALAEVEDATSTSAKSTLAQLRTNLLAGGAGFTATDPLVIGTLNGAAPVIYPLVTGETSVTTANTVYPYGDVRRFGATGVAGFDARAAFAAADAAAIGGYGGVSRITVPSGTHRIASNLTIASSIRFMPGAVLKPDAGVTITVNGTVSAGKAKWIDVSAGGLVAFGALAVTDVYPEWWGAVADNTTDSAPAWQAAINACQGVLYRTLRLSGQYLLSSAGLTVTDTLRMLGPGTAPGLSALATLRNTSGARNTLDIRPAAQNKTFQIEGFLIDGGLNGINLEASPASYISRDSTFRNLCIQDTVNAGLRIKDVAMIGSCHERLTMEMPGSYGFWSEGDALLTETTWTSTRVAGATVEGYHIAETTSEDQASLTFINAIAEGNLGRGVYLSSIKSTWINLHVEGNGSATGEPDIALDHNVPGVSCATTFINLYESGSSVAQAGRRIKLLNTLQSVMFIGGTLSGTIDGNFMGSSSTITFIGVVNWIGLVTNWNFTLSSHGAVDTQIAGKLYFCQSASTTSAPYMSYGTGTPQSVVTAPVGSLFIRTDGGTTTTLYVKESGTGNTGWVAK